MARARKKPKQNKTNKLYSAIGVSRGKAEGCRGLPRVDEGCRGWSFFLPRLLSASFAHRSFLRCALCVFVLTSSVRVRMLQLDFWDITVKPGFH